jgi:hypothetical protein
MKRGDQHDSLLAALKREQQGLQDLLTKSRDEWGYEDPIYRFYHHSFKVFGLQEGTAAIVTRLKALMPDRELHPYFIEIVNHGTGKVFVTSMNSEWTLHTRPIVEAFFHARFFLEMAVRYARLDEAPTALPSGWAALLTLYGLR